MSKFIIGLAKHFPAVVLTGARQVGKTTLLRNAFPSHNYVSLDLPSTAESAETESEAFLKRYPAPLIIDEIQYAPKLFRHLKRAIDANRHAMGQFILTGSQKFELMKEVSDSLAGRVAVVELEGLSLNEVGLSKFPLEHQIVRGAFPELWRAIDIPETAFYSSYLATYLERDVRQILGVTNLRDFERFIRACAARNGQLLDKTSLGCDVGVSSKAVASWLSVLQASNQIVLLEPWFANFGKRLVKTPKLYFCDTGLLCFLLGITGNEILRSPFTGSIWETLVFAEMRKSIALSMVPKSLWFYRDSQGKEVDFLCLGGNHTLLIECKWKESADKSDAHWMNDVVRIASEKNIPEFAHWKSFVVCRTSEPYSLGTGTRAIPLSELSSIFRQ
ncbi:MAG: ATP-binding protein [Candidatus Riflebacteria bacterium]|nr:ATP-binding protein [Candidatus Riflebacteria bacterium]